MRGSLLNSRLGQVAPHLHPLFVKLHALEPVEVGACIELGALDGVADVGGDGLGAGDGALNCAIVDAGWRAQPQRSCRLRLKRRADLSVATGNPLPIETKRLLNSIA